MSKEKWTLLWRRPTYKSWATAMAQDRVGILAHAVIVRKLFPDAEAAGLWVAKAGSGAEFEFPNRLPKGAVRVEEWQSRDCVVCGHGEASHAPLCDACWCGSFEL